MLGCITWWWIAIVNGGKRVAVNNNNCRGTFRQKTWIMTNQGCLRWHYHPDTAITPISVGNLCFCLVLGTISLLSHIIFTVINIIANRCKKKRVMPNLPRMITTLSSIFCICLLLSVVWPSNMDTQSQDVTGLIMEFGSEVWSGS